MAKKFRERFRLAIHLNWDAAWVGIAIQFLSSPQLYGKRTSKL